MDVHMEKASRRRFGLGAAMILVLLAAVAAASWMVDIQGGSLDRGQAIVEGMQQNLAAMLKGEGEELWYLGGNSFGKPVGWEMYSWRPVAGGYEGTSLVGMAQERVSGNERLIARAVFREQWSVSSDARSGQYVGYEGPGPGANVLTTRIDLRGKELVVSQVHGGRTASAGSPVPKAYVPEGLSRLAIRLAAAGARGSRFRMIYNSEAIGRGGEIQFGSMDVEPMGARHGMLTHMAGPDASWREDVSFDEQGRATAIVKGGTGVVFRLTTREEVARIFPEVKRLVELRAEAEREGGGDE
jgi:hypothetical protein